MMARPSALFRALSRTAPSLHSTHIGSIRPSGTRALTTWRHAGVCDAVPTPNMPVLTPSTTTVVAGRRAFGTGFLDNIKNLIRGNPETPSSKPMEPPSKNKNQSMWDKLGSFAPMGVKDYASELREKMKQSEQQGGPSGAESKEMEEFLAFYECLSEDEVASFSTATAKDLFALADKYNVDIRHPFNMRSQWQLAAWTRAMLGQLRDQGEPLPETEEKFMELMVRIRESFRPVRLKLTPSQLAHFSPNKVCPCGSLQVAKKCCLKQKKKLKL